MRKFKTWQLTPAPMGANLENKKMKTLFLRKDNQILELETKEIKTYESKNLAKYNSRHLQLQNGGLGCGAVRVVDRFPEYIK